MHPGAKQDFLAFPTQRFVMSFFQKIASMLANEVVTKRVGARRALGGVSCMRRVVLCPRSRLFIRAETTRKREACVSLTFLPFVLQTTRRKFKICVQTSTCSSIQHAYRARCEVPCIPTRSVHPGSVSCNAPLAEVSLGKVARQMQGKEKRERYFIHVPSPVCLKMEINIYYALS